LLFVIVVEALSKMISATINGGFLSSFSVGSRNYGVVNLSHLLLKDDTLIFCGTTLDHLWCGVWKCIRRGWERLSKFLRYEIGDGTKVRWQQNCGVLFSSCLVLHGSCLTG
jgi:hypothetical protein